MKFKKGDKVRRTLNDYFWQNTGLDINKPHVISRVFSNDSIELEGSNCTFMGKWFTLWERTVEEQLILANSLVGKSVSYMGGCCFKVNNVDVYFKGQKKSGSINEYLETHDICVAVSGGVYTIPVELVEIVPESIEVKLNEKHSAKVFKDKVAVGCQTFPITIIDDLKKALEELS